jgi:hypothetical protein
MSIFSHYRWGRWDGAGEEGGDGDGLGGGVPDPVLPDSEGWAARAVDPLAG